MSDQEPTPAASPVDLPYDFGEPGVVDFPDPAFDDVADDGDETPGEGEPKEDA